MPNETPVSPETFHSITLRRAQVLRELARGSTEREAATALGLSFDGIRSHVANLREITECSSVRDLARWWREYRGDWCRFICEQAGLEEQGD